MGLFFKVSVFIICVVGIYGVSRAAMDEKRLWYTVLAVVDVCLMLVLVAMLLTGT